jgi:phosphinothricin acetyltransferase
VDARADGRLPDADGEGGPAEAALAGDALEGEELRAIHATQPIIDNADANDRLDRLDRWWRMGLGSGPKEGTMIRLAGSGDAAAVAAIYAPYVTGASTSFEYEPPDPAEMAARIASTLTCTPYLVFESGGAILGFAYASKHRERAAYQWSVDVSVYVEGRAHRRGVGRALYESLFALLRLQGFYTAHAGITLPNPASIGLHEALGFRPVGVYRSVGFKHGGWHDVGWWQLPLRERTGTPAPPRALAEVQRDPEWGQALSAGEQRILRLGIDNNKQIIDRHD